MYTLLTQQQQVDPIHHLGSDIMYSNLKSPREADIGSPLNILNTYNLSELITTLVKLLVERVEQDMQQKTDGPPSTTTTTQIQDVEVREHGHTKGGVGALTFEINIPMAGVNCLAKKIVVMF